MSGVDSGEFKKHMTESDPSAYEAVVQWKYGCSSKFVCTFLVVLIEEED